jgi:hypothetical protein
MMSKQQRNRISVLALLGLILGSIAAQAAVPARIAAQVDGSRRSVLAGNVSPRLRTATELGAVPAAAKMQHMRLILSRGAEAETALTQYIDQLQDKSSPNYHRWLTPEQLGECYGVAQSDITALSAWLRSQGLSVDGVAKSRMAIEFSGSAAQVEAAFHVTLRSFQSGTQSYIANTSEPEIPTALAAVVRGVSHLNTMRPESHLRLGQTGQYDSRTERMHAVSTASGVKSELTYSSSSGDVLFVTPADAATIYDTPNSVLNINYSGTSYTGAGIKIGIGGDSNIDATYPVNYRTLFLGGDTTAPIVKVTGDDPGITTDVTESYLDLEVSGGLAPGAAIYYYPSSDLTSGIQQALDDNLVDIFSLSFGECELGLGSSGNQQMYDLWQQAAAQGITVTVSSGDNGSAGCDNDNSESTAIYGLQVSGLASTPYNIAVGGTDYDVMDTNFSTYAGTSNKRANYYRTALSYIPEATWNDSTTTNGLLASNVYNESSGSTIIVAGSGGVSACVSYDSAGNCVAGYARPGWQRGAGIPGDGARVLPDVSFLAADGAYGATWLICAPISSGSGSIEGCDTSTSTFYFSGVGGTSASTPAFAGMLALLAQANGGRLGQAAAGLYSLALTANASQIFHDVTTGNNAVVCQSGTDNCVTNAAGYDYLTGYDTAAGYDLATGLGSIDITQLIANWASATAGATPQIAATLSGTTLASTDSLTVNLQVTGSGAPPTGNITITGGGYTSGNLPLSGGKATAILQPGSLEAGSDTLSFNYSGDANYQSASSTAAVTVSKAIATEALTAASSDVQATASASITVTISGSGQIPSGTVKLSGGNFSGKNTLVNGSATFAVPASQLVIGPNTLTATYAGDSFYQGTSGSITVGVSGGTPAMTLVPSSTALYSGQSLTVPVTLTGGGIVPGGTVTLTTGSYSSGAVTLSQGAATITIPANSLAAGVDTLALAYSGDTYYSAALASTSVTVSESTFTVAGTGGNLSVAALGANSQETITVASANGYTGSVLLSCALSSSPVTANATYAPTCAINSPVTLGSGTASATATLVISTTPETSANHLPPMGKGMAVMTALLLLGLPLRRKGRIAFLMLALMLGVAVTGCGGGTTKTPVAGTSAGTYTFTVTGSGSSLSSTATVTVVIP